MYSSSKLTGTVKWNDSTPNTAPSATSGSAADEADVLSTLGMIEQYHDPARARSLFTAARAQAAAAGDLEIELRARYDDAQVGKQLGDLASAGAAFDDGGELAERSGLGWSRFGISLRRGQLAVRYLTGDWDGCERLLTAVPELVTTLAAAQVVTQGLGVLVARGETSVIAEADDADVTAVVLLTRLGARRYGGSVELIRRYPPTAVP